MQEHGRDDREALFARAVEAHGSAIQRLTRGYERVPALRDELLQEILLALWRSLGRFRGDASLRTWTFRVAHNVATSHVHRAKRRPKWSAESADEEPAPLHLLPDTALEHHERLERLLAAIETLLPLDRQIILLYLEELPQAEIASITGLSLSNVATRLGRTKRKLAKTLATPRKETT
ncbi:MAG: RNA polymerase sigma factor [Myxococcota bacterium]